MNLLARLAVIAALPFLLAGCIELNARTDLLPDGRVKTHTEIAVKKDAVQAMLQMYAEASGKPGKKSKAPKPTFASVCTKDLSTLMAEGGAQPKSKTKTKTAAKPEVTPPATTTVASERGDFSVCTLSETYTDPIPQYAAAIKKAGIPADMAKMEVLPTGDGYRYGGALRFADVMAADPTFKPAERGEMALMMALIPKDVTISMTVNGTRVENTNGTISADGKSVSWTIPLHQLVDLSPDAKPIEFKADVYFK